MSLNTCIALRVLGAHLASERASTRVPVDATWNQDKKRDTNQDANCKPITGIVCHVFVVVSMPVVCMGAADIRHHATCVHIAPYIRVKYTETHSLLYICGTHHTRTRLYYSQSTHEYIDSKGMNGRALEHSAFSAHSYKD